MRLKYFKAKTDRQYYQYFEGFLSTLLNVFLFGLKYWAGVATGSIAIIADAWHSLSDSLTSIIVIISAKISGKPADEDHPFGHGRAELIAAIIIGVLLAIVGFNFIIESVHRLQNHEHVVYSTFALVATIVSIVLKEAIAQYSIRLGKKYDSKSLIADGWHHRSDSISSGIILIGIFIGKYFWWIDGVMGIIVALIIFKATYHILKEAINPLIGESPDKKLLDSLRQISLKTFAHDLEVHHVHIHNYGDHKELTFHIHLPPDMTLQEAHHIATKFEQKISDELGYDTTIHMEPEGELMKNTNI